MEKKETPATAMMVEPLEVDVSMPCPVWKEAVPSVEDLCRHAAFAAFLEGAPGKHRASGDKPLAEVSLVLADNAFIQPLNEKYRGRNVPTNTLSFAFREDEGRAPQPQDAPEMLGDVVLAFETARAEAGAEGKSLADHLRHLVVHGVLHLLGRDHQTAKDARIMERLEIQALARLDVADPYTKLHQ